ncbi:hypothetical protein DFJ58DRAFT_744527 [Suillus subalutaceus]|uniref:uncharacterized protein n=1 Tax=Suillus subalutaceus TaxID=48586 RepID=UPI001B86A513|nr:uncharacterized protein DFJ58DRAFT_744527 [Suillus subalutaceus]KAG1860116.1 hypothetical protein DFJ58DRAFT_744527 [Suillus subalutaceus]
MSVRILFPPFRNNVLVDPSLSCALEVSEETPIEDVIFQLHQQLTTAYNELIKPFSSNKLGPLDLLIAVDGDMDRQKPVSTLSIPQSGKPLTMHFSIPQSHTFRVVFNKNEENLAQLEENKVQTLSKSSRRKRKKVASGSAVDNNASLLKEMDRMLDELTGQINDRKASMTKQNNEQAKRIKDLAELLAANAELSASVQKMNATLQHHSTMLDALHRRVILDDARALIADRYGFPVNELWSAQEGVESLVYSPAGDIIASGGFNTICIWNAKTGEPVVAPTKDL